MHPANTSGSDHTDYARHSPTQIGSHMSTHLTKPQELLELGGTELGQSSWRQITQEQVNQFADATGDHQWIHVDPERARQGPFGGPVAHGYLTLSLIPAALEEVLVIDEMDQIINYGLNKVRFPAPVPVGSQLRMALTLAGAQSRANGMIEALIDVTVELQGGTRPPCTAQAVYLYR
jgi:acyl dehydratase